MSGRGNSQKKKKKGHKPAHQNGVAFYHNKGSKKTKKILASPNEGLCEKCTAKIEWRKKYRKYKPLSAPGICEGCSKRNVRRAYHVLCDDCQRARNVCAKCKEAKEIVAEIITPAEKRQMELQEQLEWERLSEKEKRKIIREQEKEEKAAREAKRARKLMRMGESIEDGAERGEEGDEDGNEEEEGHAESEASQEETTVPAADGPVPGDGTDAAVPTTEAPVPTTEAVSGDEAAGR